MPVFSVVRTVRVIEEKYRCDHPPARMYGVLILLTGTYIMRVVGYLYSTVQLHNNNYA